MLVYYIFTLLSVNELHKQNLQIAGKS